MSFYKNNKGNDAEAASTLSAAETVMEDSEDEIDEVDADILDSLFADEEEDEEVLTEEETMAEEAPAAVTAPAEMLRTSGLTKEDTTAVTVITKGTIINGSIISDCSLDVMGTINGDIECFGKLTISGKVSGNSLAAEVFVNTEKLEGNITSEGCVKVALGTVVIGDITATSGVIAGAVKGEIDISGPVVLDSTAIIKGDIKAKSIQMNNGAILEGHCSLSYASVDIDNIFE